MAQVYDDEKQRNDTDQFDKIVGQIDPAEKAQMERSAHNGAADDIARREGLGGDSSESRKNDDKSLTANALKEKEQSGNQSDDSKGASAAGAAASLATAGTPMGLVSFAGKLLNSRKKKQAAFGGSFIVILIGLGMMAFTILQGPLEFVHASELLSGFHFSSQDDFSNKRTGRLLLYALAGKTARGRLGDIANRRADTWEKRLNDESGLKTVYSNGTQRVIGYQVIDVNKAGTYLNDMDSDGIPRANTMSGVDSNGKPIKLSDGKFVDLRNTKYKARRSFTRTAVRSVGLNKIASSLGSRLLIKRAGVNFHPLNYVHRAASDKYDEWRDKQIDEKAKEIENGPGGVENPLVAKLKEISDKLTKIIRIAKGPALAAGVICGIKSFNDSVDAQNFFNQQQLKRLGMNVVTTGEQVKYSRQSFDGEQLGVFHGQFYDDTTKTSFFDDPGIQWESGQNPTGKDYAKDAKPNSDGLPFIFKIVAGIPLGIPPVDVCTAMDAVGNLDGIKQVAEIFSKAVDAALSIFNTSQAELTQMAVDYFASGGVDPKAKGALRGGYANIGVRLAANDQFIGMGGRELTPAEGSAVKAVAYQDQAETFAKSSLYDKYFNIEDYRSVAGTLFDKTPKSPAQAIASLTRLPSTFGSTALMLLGGNKAQAAGSYDYGFPLYGFSEAEQNDPRFDNPYDNENYMLEGDRLDRMNQEYGTDCFDMTVTADGTLNYGESQDFHKIPAKCKDTGNEELLHYRFYLADIIDDLSLDCYEGNEDACAQLGVGGSGGTSGGTVGAEGWIWPIHKEDLNNQAAGLNQCWLHYYAPKNGYHAAIDIGVVNKPVYAAHDGTVVTKASDGYNTFIIDTGQDAGTGKTLYAVYEHMQSFTVGVGDHVSAGQQIGVSGAVGAPGGPHLHFGISDDQHLFGFYANPWHTANPLDFLPTDYSPGLLKDDSGTSCTTNSIQNKSDYGFAEYKTKGTFDAYK